jgi:uncharacterized protein DUF2735
MNENLNQSSARIYQFPAGGRAALATRQEAAKRHDALTERADFDVCSGSWYHEAAIQESRQSKPSRER